MVSELATNNCNIIKLNCCKRVQPKTEKLYIHSGNLHLTHGALIYDNRPNYKQGFVLQKIKQIGNPKQSKQPGLEYDKQFDKIKQI